MNIKYIFFSNSKYMNSSTVPENTIDNGIIILDELTKVEEKHILDLLEQPIDIPKKTNKANKVIIDIKDEKHRRGNRPNDQIECTLCNKVYRRSNKSAHYKTKTHQRLEELDRMYRQRAKDYRTKRI
jgi:hypothetical protein